MGTIKSLHDDGDQKNASVSTVYRRELCENRGCKDEDIFECCSPRLRLLLLLLHTCGRVLRVFQNLL